MVHKEALKAHREAETHMLEDDCWVAHVSEVPHWIIILKRRMSIYYNIIDHIPIEFRPFKVKCVFICFINYSRKLTKVFISLTHSIKVVRNMEWLECRLWGSLNRLLIEDIYLHSKSTSIGGCKHAPVAILHSKLQKCCSIRVWFLKNFRTYEQLVLIYRTNCSLGCKKTWFLIEKGGERRKKWIEKREKHDFFIIIIDVVVYIILMSCINRN